jgi:hypothetical protein
MIFYRYTIDNSTFLVQDITTIPEGVTYEELEVPEPIDEVVIPQDAKKANIKLAMIDSGISTSMVDDYIEKMPPSLEKDRISVLWYDTDTFQRRNETLNEMATIFKISQKQLDGLFILANTK